MPDQRAPEYKDADRSIGADQLSTVRTRAGVAGPQCSLRPQLWLDWRDSRVRDCVSRLLSWIIV
jgi:hypothetical protein